MQINEVKRKTPNRKSELVGRGGKRGKTSGRGQKGQNARAGRKIRPEFRDVIRKLPKKRGYMFKGIHGDYVWPVNLLTLNEKFENGETVNPMTLVKKGAAEMFAGKKPTIKILGAGEINKKLVVVDCQVSASAKEKIEKAGGSIK